MSKQDKAKKAAGTRSSREDDQQAAHLVGENPEGEETQELLPSDMNEAADISPRIAFLAYN